MQINHGRFVVTLAVAALGLLLSGCSDVRFTADLATDAPADPDISNVQVNLLGLEFRRDDGTNTKLEFRRGELTDLLDFQAGNPLRLFTDEELPVGRYSGVRLLFDADVGDNLVARLDNSEFQLLLAEGPFAPVSFSVEEEGRSRETYTLVLDLRQSLGFDETTDEYTLTPHLRAVPTDDAARIEGAVTVACPAGTSLATGGAIYLFPGTDVQPDDLDGIAPEPSGTTRVVGSDFGGFQYSLRFLEAGDYTIALTCSGNDDLPGVDDELEFRNTVNVQLDAGEVRQLNFD